MIIRRASIDDVDAIVSLRVAFLRDVREVLDEQGLRTAVAEYLARAIPAEVCVVWVAEVDEEIVAIGAMTIYERMMWDGVGREGYVLSMYTVPDFRRRGIASRIVEAMLAYAKENELRLCLIATEVGRGVYERAGFTSDPRYLRWR